MPRCEIKFISFYCEAINYISVGPHIVRNSPKLFAYSKTLALTQNLAILFISFKFCPASEFRISITEENKITKYYKVTLLCCEIKWIYEPQYSQWRAFTHTAINFVLLKES
jgi:hypothetical protein